MAETPEQTVTTPLLELELCERGNIWIWQPEEGYHQAYLRLPDGPDRWLEISIRPCNYPGLSVQTIQLPAAELAAHINKEFADGNWVVRKMNLHGVVVEDGYISEAGLPPDDDLNMSHTH